MSLSKHQAAVISDRRRLWEVRKYCQVRSVLGRNHIDNGTSSAVPQVEEQSSPDVALSSLLQLLVARLNVDIAMVSLLDEETQFYLAGAQNDNNPEPITEPAKWYGCDQISHAGGLCERTIAIENTQPPGIYEELDMTTNPRTKDLPYVKGDIAGYRHYAGAAVRTAAGIAVGTVFVMSHQPSSGLDASQRKILTDTTDNVMRQLTLNLHALEGERLMQFQNTTAAVLQRQQPSLPDRKDQKPPRKLSGLNQQPNYVVEIYHHAAEVMRRSLELDGVFFQHVSAADRKSQAASDGPKDSLLSASSSNGDGHPTCFSQSEVNNIIQTFPHGAVLQHLDRDWMMSDSEGSHTLQDPDIRVALDKCFQGSQQLLVMPLFDVLHNRTAAICVGWLSDYTRVYSETSDLPFVSAFCMSTMSEVLRLETQMLERVKSDFLGSISHEMKTPLHQILGSLELLLQTSCSDEQYDFAVNARFGATQLLETIDKILLYSSISSEADGKAQVPSEIDNILGEKDVPQIIGPRSEHVAGAASPVDLVRMCEEVVEDTTKRIRLLETIMSPVEQEEQEGESVTHSEASVSQATDPEKDPFTIVVFDASPIERVQVPRNTGFRVILENLLSNAIKFTRAGCCARVCLELSPDKVKLIISDCGYGMSEDFVRHNIYLPFAQQDPVASGMGLGLSLVKRNVDRLGGTVDFETDQASGTTATISISTKDLVAGMHAISDAHSDVQVPAGIIPSIPKRPKDSLPFMHACFYAPSTWMHRYDQRDKRSIDLVFDSLSSTLSEWYQPVLSLWQRQKKRTLPDLVFISQRDLAEFQQECGDQFADVKKVVICAAVGKNTSQDRERIRQASTVADALITGAVMPSKLWEVVTKYFPHISQPGGSSDGQKSADNQEEFAAPGAAEEEKDKPAENQGSSSHESPPEPESQSDPLNSDNQQSDGSAEDQQRSSHDSPSKTGSQNENPPNVDSQQSDDHSKSPGQAAAADVGTEKNADVETDATANSETADVVNKLLRTVSNPALDARKTTMKRNLTAPILQGSAQPHVLLVDDNNVNLKMLGMFISKCGIPAAHSTSVIGGREAIEAYKSFESANSTTLGFDIILMDLSMPEVTGFEATSAIREIEKASDVDHKAYIVALTGLVSDKDRNAAHEAGVDDYVTKPAGLQKVRAIIEAWQKKKYDFAG